MRRNEASWGMQMKLVHCQYHQPGPKCCQLEDKGGTGQPEQVDAVKFGAINSNTHVAGTGATCTLRDLQHPGIECPPAILFEAVRKQGGPEAVRRAQNFFNIANAPTLSVLA
jgi:hypothetical protein